MLWYSLLAVLGLGGRMNNDFHGNVKNGWMILTYQLLVWRGALVRRQSAPLPLFLLKVDPEVPTP